MKIKETVSGKRLWIITSKNWEKYRSPPSLFEYLSTTVFRCAIESLASEFQCEELRKLDALQTVAGKHREMTRGFILTSHIDGLQ
jgi:hypothetical protein